MSRDTTVIAFCQPDIIDDPLTELAREGARRILAQVLTAEADAFVAMWKDEKLSDGRDRIVRHGHGPHRAIQTGVGPVEVRRAKVRDRGHAGENPIFLGDPAEMGAADEEPRRAVASSLPARSINRRLPGGACACLPFWSSATVDDSCFGLR
jgi:hypothetical protein